MSHRAPAFTVWFTGLSGAGKSTLANALRDAPLFEGRSVALLDGDVLRTGLCRDLGFSEADRSENIRRVAEVARLMNDAGVDVLCALISPLVAQRAQARQIIRPERFVEVHVATPLEVCETRDPKGLYRKARAGQIPQFTGIDSAYEAPERPDIRIDAGAEPPVASVGRLVDWLSARFDVDQGQV
jgi:adenylyl-sulfate kinase